MANPYQPETRVFDPDRALCIQSPELILGTVDWGRCIHVGAGTKIQAEGGVRVGDYVVISYDCVIWTINHDYRDRCIPYGAGRIRKPVTIENGVWIGRNALINGGVTIGEGAVVGMGAVVARDIPPLGIAVGNPARVVGFRPLNTYLEAKRQGLTLWKNHGICGACENPDFHLPATSVPSFSSDTVDTFRRFARPFNLWLLKLRIKRRLRAEAAFPIRPEQGR